VAASLLLRRIYERNLLETGVIIGTDNDHCSALLPSSWFGSIHPPTSRPL